MRQFVSILSFLFLAIWTSTVQSQDSLSINSMDTIPGLDSMLIGSFDSLGISSDSILPETKNYVESEDALSDEIDYGSKGRKKIDVQARMVHLWDEAYVNYQNITVKGDYITFDLENNIATAIAVFDTTGRLLSKATFQEGENTFQYDYLRYNFKTKKALVKQTVAKEGELFVHGALTKFVGAIDSTDNDHIYNQDAIVTSCNLDHPHFGIESKKLKVVPNKLAIIGPSRLVIGGVPTPLWLPFGFFPISTGKSSGMILPKSYDLSQALGFGLKDIGYYFPINDYVDLKVTGDIYLRGSWALNNELKYNKRYKYSGGFRFSRSSLKLEDNETGGYSRDVSYQLRWNHSQDRKAHPYRTFTTSVNIMTSGFLQNNLVDARSRGTDNLSSNITYAYQFGESAWSFSGGANFTQSLTTGVVDLEAPKGTINMRQIYPFKRKEAIGKERWYEKIGLKYSSEFKNRLEATDSTFFKVDTWKDAKYGVHHEAKTSASFKFLKYFSFNPSANYSEIWYFKEVNKELTDELTLDSIGTFTNAEEETVIVYDTAYGELITNIENAFLPFRTGGASAGVSTKLFWTEQKAKGFLRGFRHTITPSMSVNYNPDTKSPYDRTLDADFRDDVFLEEEYTIIPSGVFRASPREKNLSFQFSAENNIEIKYYSKKDSTAKKYKLTNFRFATNYNFVKDSLKLADQTLTGRTSFFKNRSSIRYGFMWNPYKTRNGRKVDELFFEDEFELPTLSLFTLNTTTRITFSEIQSWITGEKEKSKKKKNTKVELIPISDLFNNFSFEYKLNYRYSNQDGIIDKGISSHVINVRGNLQITDKWYINLGNFGYDFKRKGYTYPDFGFSRDLHCWTMTFSWQPRGGTAFSTANSTSTFNFFIGVRSGTLDFLKYNYTKGYNSPF